MLSFMGRDADLSPEEQAQLETYKSELTLQGKSPEQQIQDLAETAPQILETLDIPLEDFKGAAEEAGLDIPPAIFEDQQDPITPEDSEVTESDIPGPDVGVVASEDTEVDLVPTSPEESQQEDADLKQQEDQEVAQQDLQ